MFVIMMRDRLFSGHSEQPHGAPTWLRRVFSVVEDEHVGGRSLGGDDAGVLGHVARSIHLALVVDLDLNLNLPTDGTEATEL